MHAALGKHIQLGKTAAGKNPLASLGSAQKGASLFGAKAESKDFSDLLSVLTGESAHPKMELAKMSLTKTGAKLDEKMIAKLMEGEIPEGLTPAEALEFKQEALLTSKNHAAQKLVKEVKTEDVLKTELQPVVKAEGKELEGLLKTDMKKVVELPLAKKNDLEVPMMKNEVLPQKRGELPLADNSEILNLRQTVKNSKVQASKEYAKGQNPFETNVIQLKKAPKFEKEITASSEQETMKPFDLLVRDAATQVQAPKHEAQMSLHLGGTQQAAKALDLSNTNSSAEVINKIVNYLEQNNIQNSDRIEVVVKHESLGQFHVNVQRAGKGEELNIQIMTQTQAGHEFFVNNENQLNKTLLDHGLKLADFRIQNISAEGMAMNKGMDNQSFSGNFSNNDQSGQRYYNERQPSQDQDSRRRQELWEQYKERSFA